MNIGGDSSGGDGGNSCGDGENGGRFCWCVPFIASRSDDDGGDDDREAEPEGKLKEENDGELWNEDEV